MSPITYASRRDFLAALGLSAVLPAGKMFAQAAVDVNAKRIDMHGHLTPPIVLETVGAAELGNFAKWTPEIALEQMEKYGIATAMLSVPPHYDPKTVDRVARPSNEYGARLAQDHKGRFGNFAFLPMPHVDATLKEIEYVFDTLKLDGVGMYTNYGDKWIGDAAFNPVFEELNRRKTVVFTHPITANCCGNLLANVGDGTIEWQTDTTRAIANMLFNGAAMRYPNVRVDLFSWRRHHALPGGALHGCGTIAKNGGAVSPRLFGRGSKILLRYRLDVQSRGDGGAPQGGAAIANCVRHGLPCPIHGGSRKRAD